MKKFYSLFLLLFCSITLLGQQVAVKSVRTLADLKRLNTSDLNNVVTVLGTSSVDDGTGGLWYFDKNSSATADDVDVAVGAGPSPGRWIRIDFSVNGGIGNILANVQNVINVKASPYNAVGNGTTDDRNAFQKAFNAARVNHSWVYIPEGNYRIVSTEPLVIGEIAGMYGPGKLWNSLPDGYVNSNDYVTAQSYTATGVLDSTGATFTWHSDTNNMPWNGKTEMFTGASNCVISVTIDGGWGTTTAEGRPSGVIPITGVRNAIGENAWYQIFNNSKSVTFRDCKMFNSVGSYIEVGQDVKAESCIFGEYGDHVFYFGGGETNLVFINNKIQVGRAAVSTAGNVSYVGQSQSVALKFRGDKYVTVADNILYDTNRLCSFIHLEANTVQPGDVDSVVIHGNNATGASFMELYTVRQDGQPAYKIKNVAAYGNTMDLANDVVLGYFFAGDNISIYDNKITRCTLLGTISAHPWFTNSITGFSMNRNKAYVENNTIIQVGGVGLGLIFDGNEITCATNNNTSVNFLRNTPVGAAVDLANNEMAFNPVRIDSFELSNNKFENGYSWFIDVGYGAYSVSKTYTHGTHAMTEGTYEDFAVVSSGGALYKNTATTTGVAPPSAPWVAYTQPTGKARIINNTRISSSGAIPNQNSVRLVYPNDPTLSKQTFSMVGDRNVNVNALGEAVTYLVPSTFTRSYENRSSSALGFSIGKEIGDVPFHVIGKSNFGGDTTNMVIAKFEKEVRPGSSIIQFYGEQAAFGNPLEIEINGGNTVPFRWGTTYLDTIFRNTYTADTGPYGSIYFGTGTNLLMKLAGGTNRWTNTIYGNLIVTTNITSTSATVTDLSVANVALSGSIVFPDGVRQTFNPGTFTPGLNVGANSGDPSVLQDGDIWYNSATGKFRKRENGSTSNMDTTGAGSTVTVRDEDGTPTAAVDTIKFPNGTVTDNGDGSVSVSAIGGGGDDWTVNSTSLIDPDLQNTSTIVWVLDTAPIPDTIKAYATNITNAEISGSANISATKLESSVIIDTEINTSAKVAGIVGDETGSGLMVFGANPTITDPLLSGTTTIGGDPALSANQITIGTTGIIFEGSTANISETLLTVTDPTSDRTITLPDASGTVILNTAIDTSAEIAALVGDETGSGALVFGTSPTISSGSIIDPVLSGTTTIGASPALSANQVTVGTTGFIFEGATANTSEGLLTSADVTADRTWTLPDATGTIVVDSQINTSSALITFMSDETGTGSLVFGTSPTLTTPIISGAIVFPDGTRQTFNPNGTAAGINVGAQAGDPSSLVNGDIWYNSTLNALRAYIGGSAISLGAGGGGGGGDVTASLNFGNDNRLIRSDGVLKGVQSSGVTIDDSDNVTIPGTLTVGSGSGASQIIMGDTDQDHFVILNPNGTTTTDINITFPAAPATGLWYSTVSGTTNEAITHISTLAGLETGLGSINIIQSTEIDTSAEVAALVGDETGSGALVFGTSPAIGTATLTDPTWVGTSTVGADPALAANRATYGTTGIIFEGATADAFETLLTVADPTADRTITLPNSTGTVLLDTAIDTSAELAALIGDETGSGALVFGTSPTLTTPVIDGAIVFPDGVRQTFNPGSFTPGINVGANSGDPSILSDGDLWYDLITGNLRARINGATVSLGGVGSVVNNAAFSSAWSGETGNAPSRNTLYNYLHTFDTDDDGKVNVLDIGAGIVKTDSSGVVSVATAGTDYTTPSSTESPTNKTFDAGATGNTLKTTGYIKLSFPRNIDGAGCVYANSNNVQNVNFMVPQFSGTAATNANYCRFGFRWPKDFDSSVDVKASLTMRLAGDDTAAASYHVGLLSVANSANGDGSAANFVALGISADASGASGDEESVEDVTLTNWKSNVTAGQWCIIELRRDGANDASTVAAYLQELELAYGQTQ